MIVPVEHSRSGAPPASWTETGAMRVSTPEATALDLVRYAKSAGQLGNVVAVLSKLSERLNPERLVEAARAEVEEVEVDE